MADYVSREVAHERLYRACKAGSIMSVVILLIGLVYAGIAAIIATNVRLPDFVWSILYVIVPTMSNTTLALADCATKAALFLLISIIGLLMFRKVSKTGDAFRSGQLKQLKFIAFMFILLGFLPSLVGNGVNAFMAIRNGGSPLAVMSFAFDAMCIICGLVSYLAARVLAAGAVVNGAESQAIADTSISSAYEPSYTSTTDYTSGTDYTSATDYTSTPSIQSSVQETVTMSDLGYTSETESMSTVDATTSSTDL